MYNSVLKIYYVKWIPLLLGCINVSLALSLYLSIRRKGAQMNKSLLSNIQFGWRSLFVSPVELFCAPIINRARWLFDYREDRRRQHVFAAATSSVGFDLSVERPTNDKVRKQMTNRYNYRPTVTFWIYIIEWIVKNRCL